MNGSSALHAREFDAANCGSQGEGGVGRKSERFNLEAVAVVLADIQHPVLVEEQVLPLDAVQHALDGFDLVEREAFTFSG